MYKLGTILSSNVIPWVPKLPDILEPKGGLSTLSQPLLQAQPDILAGLPLLDGLLLGRILRLKSRISRKEP